MSIETLDRPATGMGLRAAALAALRQAQEAERERERHRELERQAELERIRELTLRQVRQQAENVFGFSFADAPEVGTHNDCAVIEADGFYLRALNAERDPNVVAVVQRCADCGEFMGQPHEVASTLHLGSYLEVADRPSYCPLCLNQRIAQERAKLHAADEAEQERLRAAQSAYLHPPRPSAAQEAQGLADDLLRALCGDPNPGDLICRLRMATSSDERAFALVGALRTSTGRWCEGEANDEAASAVEWGEQ